MDILASILNAAVECTIRLLTERAVRRFVSLRGSDQTTENRGDAIQDAVRRTLLEPGGFEMLRDFVDTQNFETNGLYQHLNRQFATDSNKPS